MNKDGYIPGSIFIIPTKKQGEVGFLLGRVLRSQSCEIVEVFDEFYSDFSCDAIELTSDVFLPANRLFPPIMVVFIFGEYEGRKKWPIIGSCNNFKIEDVMEDVVFLTPLYPRNGLYVKGDRDYFDPAGSRSRIAEDATIWQPMQLIFRIRYYMDGTYEKGQIFNYSDVAGPLHKSGKLTEILDEATDISVTVCDKWKLANKPKKRGTGQKKP